MPPRWTIDIDNGKYVFESTTRWSIRRVANLNENGVTESFETIIAIEGTLVGEAPDPAVSSTQKHIDLEKQVLRLAPFRLQLKLDGTTKFDFKPESSLGTPKIREIVELPHGASHATHVKYALTIYVKTTVSADNVFEFEIESDATYYNDRLLQQVWRASAKGLTLEHAKAFVLGFKPAGVKPLLESHHQSLRVNRYAAQWIYDKTKGDGVTRISEQVTITPAGHPAKPDRRVGKNAKPAVFRGRFQEGTVQIVFEIEATDPALIQAPAAHFGQNGDGGDLVRDVTREPRMDPSLFDSARGLYVARFTEFWFLLGPGKPQPVHADDHDKPFPERSLPPIKGGVTFR